MPQPDPHIIISGGGTGGHIFPALAIARALKEKVPEAKILFIGAKGRMEMEKVPAAGFQIKGLWISGLRRDLSIGNLMFPFKVIHSTISAAMMIQKYKAAVAVGVGGYASGPALRAASFLGIPTLIQEQNSYPGITNKVLGKKAQKICVAYEGLDKFFKADKIVLTGNPVRKDVIDIEGKRNEGAGLFGLDENKPVVLVIGGSQGALSINKCIKGMLPQLKDKQVQVIWQTGSTFHEQAMNACDELECDDIRAVDFIHRMDLAYALADIVVSRAGAIAIAELALVRKPVIFIPFPAAAEDHQMKNAMKLADAGAAMVIHDRDAVEALPGLLFGMMEDEAQRRKLSEAIGHFAMPDADVKIADEIIKLIKQ